MLCVCLFLYVCASYKNTAHKGSEECTDLLVNANCDADIQDENNETPLMKAVRKNASECVKVLVLAGASLLLQNNQGKSAPILAVEKKSYEALDAFVKHAMESNSTEIERVLNLKDDYGFTPLISAAKYKALDCLDLILNVADSPETVNAVTNDEETALMWAARVKSIECIKKLIIKRADTLKKSKIDGATVLHIATKSFSPDIIIELLSGGAELDAKDNDGQTALDYYIQRTSHPNYKDMLPFIIADAPVDKKTNQLLKKSFHSWFYFLDPSSKVKEADVIKMVDHILTLHPLSLHARDLCHTTSDGRDIFNMVTPAVRKAMENHIYFHKRYNIGKSIHKSATSYVLFAQDVIHDENISSVALKFFKDKEQFERERKARDGLDDSCVIPILNFFDSDCDDEFKASVEKMSFEEYRYMVSMPASEKSLDDIIRHDSICGDYEKIRVVIDQICRCLKLIHKKGKIHGDIKPLNIMRDHDGQFILIDLDACVNMNEICGVKLSTSYLPPEMFDFNESKCIIKSPAVEGYTGECVAASHAFDAWALGVILYQMCTGETLWKTDVQDNLVDVRDMIDLCDWNPAFKATKLRKIDDSKSACRNLLSQLLSKDPKNRPDIDHVISHPYLTGHQPPCRLPGEKPKFRVFLSYRVDADAKIVEAIYKALKKLEVTVWWDKVCLEMGEDWETGFVKGLADVDVFVPIISRAATNDPMKDHQNFSKLTIDSKCDNVLLEHRLALELLTRGMLSKIVPIFVGDKEGDTYKPYLMRDASDGTPSCKPQFKSSEPVTVRSIEEKTTSHLENMGLGMPYDTDKTVESITNDIYKFQGIFMVDDMDSSIQNITIEIKKKIMEIEAKEVQEIKIDLSIYKEAFERLKKEHDLPDDYLQSLLE